MGCGPIWRLVLIMSHVQSMCTAQRQAAKAPRYVLHASIHAQQACQRLFREHLRSTDTGGPTTDLRYQHLDVLLPSSAIFKADICL